MCCCRLLWALTCACVLERCSRRQLPPSANVLSCGNSGGRPGDTMNADKSTAIMLYNLVEALEAAGAHLQHVYFTQVCCALLSALRGLEGQ